MTRTLWLQVLHISQTELNNRGFIMFYIHTNVWDTIRKRDAKVKCGNKRFFLYELKSYF